MGPLQLFLGERDLGKQKSSLIFFLAYLSSLSIVPMVMGDYEAMNFAYFLLNIPLGLSVTLVWGYCGILCFGQIAFFGVAISFLSITKIYNVNEFRTLNSNIDNEKSKKLVLESKFIELNNKLLYKKSFIEASAFEEESFSIKSFFWMVSLLSDN